MVDKNTFYMPPRIFHKIFEFGFSFFSSYMEPIDPCGICKPICPPNWKARLQQHISVENQTIANKENKFVIITSWENNV